MGHVGSSGFPPPAKNDKVEVASDIAHRIGKISAIGTDINNKLKPVITTEAKATLRDDLRKKELDPVGAILGRPGAPQSLDALANTLHGVDRSLNDRIDAAKKAISIMKRTHRTLDTYTKITTGTAHQTLNNIRPTAGDRQSYLAEAKAVEEAGEALYHSEPGQPSLYDKDKATSLTELDKLYNNREFYDELRKTGLFQDGVEIFDPAVPANAALRAGPNTLQSKHKKLYEDAYEKQKTAAKKAYDDLVKANLEAEKKAVNNALILKLYTEHGLEFDPNEYDMAEVETWTDEKFCQEAEKALNRKIVFRLEKGFLGSSWGEKNIVMVNGHPTIPIDYVTEKSAQLVFDHWRRKNPGKANVTLSLSFKAQDRTPYSSEIKRLKLLAMTYANGGVQVSINPPHLFNDNDWKEIEEARESARLATVTREKNERENAKLDAGVLNEIIEAEKNIRIQMCNIEILKETFEEKYDSFITHRPPPPTPLTPAEEQELVDLFTEYQQAQEKLSDTLNKHQFYIHKAHEQNSRNPLSFEQKERWVEDEKGHVKNYGEYLRAQRDNLNEVDNWMGRLPLSRNATVDATLTATRDKITSAHGILASNNYLQTKFTSAVAELKVDEDALERKRITLPAGHAPRF